MKSFCFFSEKGGVGKSLHTMMFASYLRYHCRKRVLVLDLETRKESILSERESELKFLGSEDSVLSKFLKRQGEPVSFYDITRPFDVSDLSVFDNDTVNGIVSSVWNSFDEYEKEYDYVLLDFHPDFELHSVPFKLLCSGISDYIVIPISVDNISRMCALRNARQLLANEQRVSVFWNNVSRDDIVKPGYLDSGEVVFREHGIEVMPERIKTFRKAWRDMGTRLFVKSTVCWPDKYVRMSCPELVTLYDDLKSRLDM